MITYLKGDATYPQGEGLKLIPHVCNDQGGWGAGFVLAISKRWHLPEEVYREEFREGLIRLGVVQFIQVEDDIVVANMVAQRGYGRGNQNQHRSSEEDDRPPIDYEKLESCLRGVERYATVRKATMHMPRIACGLAGGKWSEVEPIINRVLRFHPTFVYDLP